MTIDLSGPQENNKILSRRVAGQRSLSIHLDPLPLIATTAQVVIF
jgi:hypothetical protein